VTVARERLARFPNVEVMQGDMHTLAFPDASFDRVLMMHTLTYAADPASALAEGTRVLRRGGTLLATTLNRHAHRDTLETYGHANQGFAPSHLTKLARSAGLSVVSCAISTREKRPPHYEVIALLAQRP
jgi:ArsR family transcriptional regulator